MEPLRELGTARVIRAVESSKQLTEVLGGNVNGGQVYGEWPGLQREQRYEGRDLAITTDFRDLFGEVADTHLALQSRQSLFPGHTLDPRSYKGLIKT